MKSLLCLFPFFLWATVNEPCRLEVFSGYRNDRIHWHLQDPGEGAALTYSELSRDLQFWENGLSLQGIYRDFVFFLKGSYGTFGEGALFQRYGDLSFTSSEPHFRFSPRGWAADGTGYFGYAANLTNDRTYQVLLIPLIGFLVDAQKSKRTNPRPNPFSSSEAIGFDSFSMESTLPSQLEQIWYGLVLGGEFFVDTGGPLSFHAGYAYQWLHLHFHSAYRTQTLLFDGDVDPVSTQIEMKKINVSDGGNLGHRGWASFAIAIGPAWKMGLGGEMRYGCSRVLDARSISQKFKLRWTSLSGWLTCSRSF